MTTLSATGAPARLTKPTGSIVPNVLASEWTKIRSVRSTYWTLLAAAVLTIGLSAVICAVVAAQYAGMTAVEKASIDPTSLSTSGGVLAQLAIAVLGVLVITSEYASGMIRTTLSAVPQRLAVLLAKAVVFLVVTLAVVTPSAFIAFFLGQAILSTKHIGVGIGAPDALRMVVGTALYLAVLGLLALGIGALLRRTAGAITAIVGILFVLPALGSLLPSSLDKIEKFLPINAGRAILTGTSDLRGASASLSPWVGLGVFFLWAVVVLGAAGYTLVRRDA
ncbi:MAG: type transport system permease protein [Actinomycetota bacterium]|nr:type transport system permease protein [Actinomycetota bacterium]